MYIRKRYNLKFKTTIWLIILAFCANTIMPVSAAAQVGTILNLPVPGTMVAPSPAFVPTILKGIKIHPDNPFKFDFLIDTGHTDLAGEPLKDETKKLIKYFMASLTTPEDDIWVNLSPYEQDRIVPAEFGQTEMGRDLLAQDYLLKQLTASLTYPEGELGKKFWEKIREKAQERYGEIDIPMSTFNKVWITPDKAVMYENGDTAFIKESRLKVMLEEDYTALRANTTQVTSHKSQEKNEGSSDIRHTKYDIPISEKRKADGKSSPVSELPVEKKNNRQTGELANQVLKELVIPELEREVNEGKHFAQLRQIFHSLILAMWFKDKLKKSLLGQLYVDQKKIRGVDVEDKEIKEKIYRQYLEAYKKGVYDYIREDHDTASRQIIPRKYFSGGFAVSAPFMSATPGLPAAPGAGQLIAAEAAIDVEGLRAEAEDPAMMTNHDIQHPIEQKMKSFIQSSKSFSRLMPVLYVTKRRQAAIDLLNAGLEILEFFKEKRHIISTLENTAPNMIYRSHLLLEELRQKKDKLWVWMEAKERMDFLRTVILRYQNRMNVSWGETREDTTIQRVIKNHMRIISEDGNMPINFKGGFHFPGVFRALFSEHRGDRTVYKQLVFELAALLLMDGKYFENEISNLYAWCQKEEDYRIIMTIGGLAHMIAHKFSGSDFKALMPRNLEPEVDNDHQRNIRRLLGFLREQKYADVLLNVVLGNHFDPWAPWHIDASVAALEALQAVHFVDDRLRLKTIEKLNNLAGRIDTSKTMIVKEKIEETIEMLNTQKKSPEFLKIYEKLFQEFEEYISTAKVREMRLLKKFEDILRSIPNLQLDYVGWIEFSPSGLPTHRDPIDMLSSEFPTGEYGVTGGFDFVHQKGARDAAIKDLIAQVSIDYDESLRETLGNEYVDDPAILSRSPEAASIEKEDIDLSEDPAMAVEERAWQEISFDEILPFVNQENLGYFRTLELIDRQRLAVQVPMAVVSDISQMGLTREDLLTALANIQQGPTNWGLDVSFDPKENVTNQQYLFLQDLRQKIHEKQISGDNELVIYEIGLGENGNEFKDFIKAAMELLEAETGADFKNWRIYVSAIDIKAQRVKEHREMFTEIIEKYRQKGISFELSVVEASALKISELKQVFRQEGHGKKADYVFHRHVTYANNLAGLLTLQDFSKEKLSSALNIYLQTKNIIQTFARQGTRYIIDPLRWHDSYNYQPSSRKRAKYFTLSGTFIVPDPREVVELEEDGTSVPAGDEAYEMHRWLRQVGSGIYIVNNVNAINRLGFREFLADHDAIQKPSTIPSWERNFLYQKEKSQSPESLEDPAMAVEEDGRKNQKHPRADKLVPDMKAVDDFNSWKQASQNLIWSDKVQGMPVESLEEKDPAVEESSASNLFSDQITENLALLRQNLPQTFGDSYEALDAIFGKGQEEISRVFLKTVSLLRKKFDYQLNKDDPRGNLKFALEKGIYFQIGGNLYLTPITGSFRRHIIFAVEEGKIKFAAEVMVPGELAPKIFFDGQNRQQIAEEIMESYPGEHYTVAPVFLRRFPTGHYELYGANYFFGILEPLEVIAFDYQNDGKRLSHMNPWVLDQVASDLGVTRREVDEFIARRIADIMSGTMALGYSGFQWSGFDYHLENFRISFNKEGKNLHDLEKAIVIELVADFEAFEKPRGLRRWAYQRMDESLILHGTQNFRGLRDLLGLPVHKLYQIFFDQIRKTRSQSEDPAMAVRLSEDEQERQINELANTMEEALYEHLVSVFGEHFSQKARIVHSGSTSRGTNIFSLAQPGFDLDFDIYFTDEEDLNRYAGFLAKNRNKGILKAAFEKKGWQLTHNHAKEQFFGTRNKDRYLRFYYDIAHPAGAVAVAISLKPARVVPYNNLFETQMEQFRTFGIAFDQIKADIRKMKLWFDAGGIYNQGGFPAIGIEQLIIQSGLSEEFGLKILEPGSFRKAVDWILRAGLDEQGNIRPWEKARAEFVLYNPVHRQAFSIQSGIWEKIVQLAIKIKEAGYDFPYEHINDDRTAFFLKDLLPAFTDALSPAAIQDPAMNTVSNGIEEIGFENILPFLDNEERVHELVSSRHIKKERLAVQLPLDLISELSEMGFTREDILKSLATIHQGPTNWGRDLAFDHVKTQKVANQRYLLIEDLKVRIQEKIIAGNKELIIYEIGLGEQGNEFKELMEAILQTLEAETAAVLKDWKVRVIAIDINNSRIQQHRRTFDEIVQAYRQRGIDFDLSVAEASALKISELREIFSKQGQNKKADYVFHRHVSYANSYAWLLTLRNFNKKHLATALNIFLQSRNILDAFAQNDTRYVIDPLRWYEDYEISPREAKVRRLVLPAASILADERTVSELKEDGIYIPVEQEAAQLHRWLRHFGTGIYVINNLEAIQRLSFRDFLSAHDSVPENNFSDPAMAIKTSSAAPIIAAAGADRIWNKIVAFHRAQGVPEKMSLPEVFGDVHFAVNRTNWPTDAGKVTSTLSMYLQSRAVNSGNEELISLTQRITADLDRQLSLPARVLPSLEESVQIMAGEVRKAIDHFYPSILQNEVATRHFKISTSKLSEILNEKPLFSPIVLLKAANASRRSANTLMTGQPGDFVEYPTELEEVRRIFGENLLRELSRIGMQQKELCERTGITRTNMSSILAGDSLPDLTVIHKIAGVLNVDYDALFRKNVVVLFPVEQVNFFEEWMHIPKDPASMPRGTHLRFARQKNSMPPESIMSALKISQTVQGLIEVSNYNDFMLFGTGLRNGALDIAPAYGVSLLFMGTGKDSVVKVKFLPGAEARKALGPRLARLRILQGLETTDVERLANLPRYSINPLETGEGSLKFKRLLAIARVLRFPPDLLLAEDNIFEFYYKEFERYLVQTSGRGFDEPRERGSMEDKKEEGALKPKTVVPVKKSDTKTKRESSTVVKSKKKNDALKPKTVVPVKRSEAETKREASTVVKSVFNMLGWYSLLLPELRRKLNRIKAQAIDEMQLDLDDIACAIGPSKFPQEVVGMAARGAQVIVIQPKETVGYRKEDQTALLKQEIAAAKWQVKRLTGIDLERSILYRQQSLEKTELKRNSIQAVTVSEVLGFVENPQEFFEKLLPALKPGGFVFLGGIEQIQNAGQTEIFEHYLQSNGIEFEVVREFEEIEVSGKPAYKLYQIKEGYSHPVSWETKENSITPVEEPDYDNAIPGFRGEGIPPQGAETALQRIKAYRKMHPELKNPEDVSGKDISALFSGIQVAFGESFSSKASGTTTVLARWIRRYMKNDPDPVLVELAEQFAGALDELVPILKARSLKSTSEELLLRRLSENIIEHIHRYARENKKSLADSLKDIGLGTSTYQLILKGAAGTSAMSALTLCKLADFFELPVGTLLRNSTGVEFRAYETDKEILKNIIAGNLKVRRERKGISRRAFAVRIGMSYQNYKDIEQGKVLAPVGNLFKMARELDTDLDQLLTPGDETVFLDEVEEIALFDHWLELPSEIDAKAIGELLRFLRLSRGKSFEDIAALFGVNRWYLNDLEVPEGKDMLILSPRKSSGVSALTLLRLYQENLLFLLTKKLVSEHIRLSDIPDLNGAVLADRLELLLKLEGLSQERLRQRTDIGDIDYLRQLKKGAGISIGKLIDIARALRFPPDALLAQEEDFQRILEEFKKHWEEFQQPVSLEKEYKFLPVSPKHVGAWIREARLQSGLSLETAAGRLHIPIETLGDLEAGISEDFRPDILLAMAKVYGVSVFTLLSGRRKIDRPRETELIDAEDPLAVDKMAMNVRRMLENSELSSSQIAADSDVNVEKVARALRGEKTSFWDVLKIAKRLQIPVEQLFLVQPAAMKLPRGVLKWDSYNNFQLSQVKILELADELNGFYDPDDPHERIGSLIPLHLDAKAETKNFEAIRSTLMRIIPRRLHHQTTNEDLKEMIGRLYVLFRENSKYNAANILKSFFYGINGNGNGNDHGSGAGTGRSSEVSPNEDPAMESLSEPEFILHGAEWIWNKLMELYKENPEIAPEELDVKQLLEDVHFEVDQKSWPPNAGKVTSTLSIYLESRAVNEGDPQLRVLIRKIVLEIEKVLTPSWGGQIHLPSLEESFEIFAQEVGRRISPAMSQGEMAKLTGIHRNQVSEMLRGKPVPLHVLLKTANVLQEPLNRLFLGVDGVFEQYPETEEDIIEALRFNLAKQLHRQKMSQKELSDLTGISAPKISNIMRGQYLPRLSTIHSLATALRVDYDALLRKPKSKNILLFPVKQVDVFEQWPYLPVENERDQYSPGQHLRLLREGNDLTTDFIMERLNAPRSRVSQIETDQYSDFRVMEQRGEDNGVQEISQAYGAPLFFMASGLDTRVKVRFLSREQLRTRLGQRLEEVRQLRGLSFSALALATGIDKGYLPKIFKNEKSPRFFTLIAICRALRFPIDILMAEDQVFEDALKKFKAYSKAFADPIAPAEQYKHLAVDQQLIGTWMREARLTVRLSIEEAAKRLKISASALKRIEQGRQEVPVKLVPAMADIYQTPVFTLITGRIASAEAELLKLFPYGDWSLVKKHFGNNMRRIIESGLLSPDELAAQPAEFLETLSQAMRGGSISLSDLIKILQQFRVPLEEVFRVSAEQLHDAFNIIFDLTDPDEERLYDLAEEWLVERNRPWNQIVQDYDLGAEEEDRLKNMLIDRLRKAGLLNGEGLLVPETVLLREEKKKAPRDPNLPKGVTQWTDFDSYELDEDALNSAAIFLMKAYKYTIHPLYDLFDLRREKLKIQNIRALSKVSRDFISADLQKDLNDEQILIFLERLYQLFKETQRLNAANILRYTLGLNGQTQEGGSKKGSDNSDLEDPAMATSDIIPEYIYKKTYLTEFPLLATLPDPREDIRGIFVEHIGDVEQNDYFVLVFRNNGAVAVSRDSAGRAIFKVRQGGTMELTEIIFKGKSYSLKEFKTRVYELFSKELAVRKELGFQDGFLYRALHRDEFEQLKNKGYLRITRKMNWESQGTLFYALMLKDDPAYAGVVARISVSPYFWKEREETARTDKIASAEHFVMADKVEVSSTGALDTFSPFGLYLKESSIAEKERGDVSSDTGNQGDPAMATESASQLIPSGMQAILDSIQRYRKENPELTIADLENSAMPREAIMKDLNFRSWKFFGEVDPGRITTTLSIFLNKKAQRLESVDPVEAALMRQTAQSIDAIALQNLSSKWSVEEAEKNLKEDMENLFLAYREKHIRIKTPSKVSNEQVLKAIAKEIGSDIDTVRRALNRQSISPSTFVKLNRLYDRLKEVSSVLPEAKIFGIKLPNEVFGGKKVNYRQLAENMSLNIREGFKKVRISNLELARQLDVNPNVITAYLKARNLPKDMGGLFRLEKIFGFKPGDLLQKIIPLNAVEIVPLSEQWLALSLSSDMAKEMSTHFVFLRQEMGLEQAEIAELSGVVPQAIQTSESGRREDFNLHTIRRRIDLYDTSLFFVFSGKVSPQQIALLNYEDMKKSFGPRLQRVRELRQLGKKQLEKMAQLTKGYITKYETGKNFPSAFNFSNICRALRFPPDIFWAEDEVFESFLKEFKAYWKEFSKPVSSEEQNKYLTANLKYIGAWMREARLAADLSLEEASEKLGIGPKELTRIEMGVNENVSVRLIPLMADLYRVSIFTLITGRNAAAENDLRKVIPYGGWSTVQKSLGRNLARIIEESSLPIDQLARSIGLSDQTIRKAIAGESLSLINLIKMLKGLNTRIEEVFKVYPQQILENLENIFDITDLEEEFLYGLAEEWLIDIDQPWAEIVKSHGGKEAAQLRSLLIQRLKSAGIMREDGVLMLNGAHHVEAGIELPTGVTRWQGFNSFELDDDGLKDLAGRLSELYREEEILPLYVETLPGERAKIKAENVRKMAKVVKDFIPKKSLAHLTPEETLEFLNAVYRLLKIKKPNAANILNITLGFNGNGQNGSSGEARGPRLRRVSADRNHEGEEDPALIAEYFKEEPHLIPSGAQTIWDSIQRYRQNHAGITLADLEKDQSHGEKIIRDLNFRSWKFFGEVDHRHATTTLSVFFRKEADILEAADSVQAALMRQTAQSIDRIALQRLSEPWSVEQAFKDLSQDVEDLLNAYKENYAEVNKKIISDERAIEELTKAMGLGMSSFKTARRGHNIEVETFLKIAAFYNRFRVGHEGKFSKDAKILGFHFPEGLLTDTKMNIAQVANHIAGNINLGFRALNISRREFLQKAGINTVVFSTYLFGKEYPRTLASLFRIEAALRMAPFDLLQETIPLHLVETTSFLSEWMDLPFEEVAEVASVNFSLRRKLMGLDQTELAGKGGLNKQDIQLLEGGKLGDFNLRTIRSRLDLYGTSLTFIVSRKINPQAIRLLSYESMKKIFGRRLERIQELWGMDERTLEKKSGIQKKFLYRYKNDQGFPSLYNFVNISRALRFPPEMFWAEDETFEAFLEEFKQYWEDFKKPVALEEQYRYITTNLKHIGTWVREARLAANLSLEEATERLRMSTESLIQIESGRGDVPAHLILYMATVYQQPIFTLLTGRSREGAQQQLLDPNDSDSGERILGNIQRLIENSDIPFEQLAKESGVDLRKINQALQRQEIPFEDVLGIIQGLKLSVEVIFAASMPSKKLPAGVRKWDGFSSFQLGRPILFKIAEALVELYDPEDTAEYGRELIPLYMDKQAQASNFDNIRPLLLGLVPASLHDQVTNETLLVMIKHLYGLLRTVEKFNAANILKHCFYGVNGNGQNGGNGSMLRRNLPDAAEDPAMGVRLVDQSKKIFNIGLLEKFINQAAQEVAQRQHLSIKAGVFGAVRYLGSLDSRDIDIRLDILSEDRSIRKDRIKWDFLQALSEILERKSSARMEPLTDPMEDPEHGENYIILSPEIRKQIDVSVHVSPTEKDLLDNYREGAVWRFAYSEPKAYLNMLYYLQYLVSEDVEIPDFEKERMAYFSAESTEQFYAERRDIIKRLLTAMRIPTAFLHDSIRKSLEQPIGAETGFIPITRYDRKKVDPYDVIEDAAMVTELPLDGLDEKHATWLRDLEQKLSRNGQRSGLEQLHESLIFLRKLGIKAGDRVTSIGNGANPLMALAAAGLGAHYVEYDLGAYNDDLKYYGITEASGSAEIISAEFSAESERPKRQGDHTQDWVLMLTGVLNDPEPKSVPTDVFREVLRVIKNKGKIVIGTYAGGGPQATIDQVLAEPQWKGKVELKKLPLILYPQLGAGLWYEMQATYEVDFTAEDPAMEAFDKENIITFEGERFREISFEQIRPYAESWDMILEDLRVKPENLAIQLPVSVIDELQSLRFSDTKLLKTLARLQNTKVPLIQSWGFSLDPEDWMREVTDQLGLLAEDFRQLVRQKNTAGEKEVLIYHVGLGAEPDEFNELADSFMTVLKEEAGKEFSNWKVHFVLMDISGYILEEAKAPVGQRRKQYGNNVEFHTIEASALKIIDLEKIRKQFGDEKADYIIHRNVTYPNEWLSEGFLTLERISASTAVYSLNIFLQMKNLLQAFGKTGTRYVVDPQHWAVRADQSAEKSLHRYFVIPGAHILADLRSEEELRKAGVGVSNTPKGKEFHARLRKTGTGIYILDDLEALRKTGFKAFLSIFDRMEQEFLMNKQGGTVALTEEQESNEDPAMAVELPLDGLDEKYAAWLLDVGKKLRMTGLRSGIEQLHESLIFLRALRIKAGDHVTSIGNGANPYMALAAAGLGAHYVDYDLGRKGDFFLNNFDFSEASGSAEMISGEFSASSEWSKKIENHTQDWVLILTGVLSEGRYMPDSVPTEVFKEVLRVVKNNGKIVIGTYEGDSPQPTIDKVLARPEWKGKVTLKELPLILYPQLGRIRWYEMQAIYEVNFMNEDPALIVEKSRDLGGIALKPEIATEGKGMNFDVSSLSCLEDAQSCDPKVLAQFEEFKKSFDGFEDIRIVKMTEVLFEDLPAFLEPSRKEAVAVLSKAP